MPAAAAAGAGHTPPAAHRQAQDAQSGGGGAKDWKSMLVRGLLIYMASQAIIGPNGLVAYLAGKTQFQRNAAAHEQKKHFLPTQDDAAAATGAAAPPPFVRPGALLPAGTETVHAWDPNQPLDVYLFLFTAPPPTHHDLATQSSILAPGGRGAWQGVGGAQEPIDFGSPAYRELLSDHVVADGQRPFIVEPAPTSASQVDTILPALKWTNVSSVGAWERRRFELELPLPESVRHANHSVWVDIIVAPSGQRIVDDVASPSSPRANGRVLRIRRLLTRLLPERRAREERKLLSRRFGRGDANRTAAGGDAGEEEEDKGRDSAAAEAKGSGAIDRVMGRRGKDQRILGHWHRNLSIALVELDERGGLPLGKMPEPLLQHVSVVEEAADRTEEGEGNGSEVARNRVQWLPSVKPGEHVAANLPLLFVNEFWNLREHQQPIGPANVTVPLQVELYATSFFRFQLLASLHDSFERQGSLAAGEFDMVKRALLETAPWYLALTVAVSLLHSLFEMLAFGSDIKDWRTKKDFKGVSLGAIVTNIICQVIVLLYLLDSSEETSWMILLSQGFGVVIEAWKITKAVTVTLRPRRADERKGVLGWAPYKLEIKDKHKLSEKEAETQQYDRQAFKVVAIVSVPLLLASITYSALYQTHRGWYSFAVHGAVQFVYAFGFCAMVPQLLVNYRLKSVAGMNFRTMIYKILGTVVDDLFAFAISMPTLHRLACFRDDLIFIIFLYQKWIYPTDYTRANEFGQVVQREDEVAATAKAGERKGQDDGEGESSATTTAAKSARNAAAAVETSARRDGTGGARRRAVAGKGEKAGGADGE